VIDRARFRTLEDGRHGGDEVVHRNQIHVAATCEEDTQRQLDHPVVSEGDPARPRLVPAALSNVVQVDVADARQ